MEQDNYIKSLFEKHIKGTASEDDEEALSEILAQYTNEELETVLELIAINILPNPAYGEDYWKQMLAAIMSKTLNSAPIKTVSIHKHLLRKWYWAAAAIVVIILGGYLLLFNKKDIVLPAVVQQVPPVDVAPPDKTKAHITLADGTVVYLDSAGNGRLAQLGNVQLVKLSSGEIAYRLSAVNPEAAAGGMFKEKQYNTLNNPRGSMVINILLADGSRVWLNTGSSVTYPVVFAGNERKVSVKGEAYFEVAKDAVKPFIVDIADNEKVEVLGTRFNVKAYADETTISTTLLEGKVKVTGGAASNVRQLSPGQQAQWNSNGQMKIHDDVDVDEIMAWKNGMFNFNGASIEEVMRQVSRWYDVDVAYGGNVSKETFSGIVSRNNNISVVLKIIERTGMKFKIEGKKIVVM